MMDAHHTRSQNIALLGFRAKSDVQDQPTTGMFITYMRLCMSF